MAVFFLTFFPVLPAGVLYMLPVVRPVHFWRRFLCFFALYIILFLALLCTRWPTPNKAMWMLRPLLSFLFTVAMVQYCLRPPWWEGLYCAIWAYLTNEFSYDLTILLLNALFSDALHMSPQSDLWKSAFTMAVISSHILTYATAYWLIARHLESDGHYPVTRRQITTPILLAALVITIKPIAVALDPEDFMLTGFTLAQVFCSFFAMATLYRQVIDGRQERLQMELALQRQLWAQHEKQLASARQQVELLNLKYHDLKHYIAALRDQPALTQQTLDEVEKAVRVFDSVLHTGNEVLDTVLTEKSLLCEQEQIVMRCVVEGALLQGLDTVDIYVLFGNAIDNAMEAVRMLQDPEQRIISLSVFRVCDLVKIQVENAYVQPLHFTGDLLDTTKPDAENHGYGLKSICRIAEQYGGSVSVEAESSYFTLHILLPYIRPA